MDGWLLRRLFYPHGRRPPVAFRRRPSGHQILSCRFAEKKRLLFPFGILLRIVFVATALVTDVADHFIIVVYWVSWRLLTYGLSMYGQEPLAVGRRG